jgi:hypothetical protein
MTELERALVALGGELEFPPAPNLVAAVRDRIERRSRRRVFAFAVAVALVEFGIATAVPDARSAILRFFHIGSVTVERVKTLPSAQERPLTSGLGAPMSRAEAERRAGFPIVLPHGLASTPTRYYVRPGLIATFLHVEGKPILLAEFQGDQAGIAKKLVGSGTFVEPVRIGQYGIWIAGGPHVITWEFGAGEPQQLKTRLAGNVLVWLAGERTYRLEGELDKAEMVRLARKITP